MQLQNWISSQFPKKVLLFAFFSRSRNPDEYFREIYLYCQNHIKDLAMATVSSLAPENYSMPGPCFQCAKNDISALTGVHIFCTIDTREREREREREPLPSRCLCAGISTFLQQRRQRI